MLTIENLKVALDSEGFKFLPNVCIVCHSGQYESGQDSMDLGAVFREFEPSLLETSKGSARDVAEAQLLTLNQSALSGNRALRSEADGAAAGVDHAVAAALRHFGEIYPSGALPSKAIDQQVLPAG